MTAPRATGRAPAPWRPEDLVRLTVLALVAVSGIGAAWYGASGQGRLSQQLSWLNLSVAALLVAGAGNLQWIVRGRRAVGERRRALLRRWEEPAVSDDGSLAMPPARGATVGQPRLVRAPGMRFAHEESCPLLAGKGVEPAQDAGAPRCAICCP